MLENEGMTYLSGPNNSCANSKDGVRYVDADRLKVEELGKVEEVGEGGYNHADSRTKLDHY